MKKNKNIKKVKDIKKAIATIDKNNKEADKIIQAGDMNKMIEKCGKELEKDIKELNFKIVDI